MNSKMVGEGNKLFFVFSLFVGWFVFRGLAMAHRVKKMVPYST